MERARDTPPLRPAQRLLCLRLREPVLRSSISALNRLGHTTPLYFTSRNMSLDIYVGIYARIAQTQRSAGVENEMFYTCLLFWFCCVLLEKISNCYSYLISQCPFTFFLAVLSGICFVFVFG